MVSVCYWIKVKQDAREEFFCFVYSSCGTITEGESNNIDEALVHILVYIPKFKTNSNTTLTIWLVFSANNATIWCFYTKAATVLSTRKHQRLHCEFIRDICWNCQSVHYYGFRINKKVVSNCFCLWYLKTMTGNNLITFVDWFCKS